MVVLLVQLTLLIVCCGATSVMPVFFDHDGGVDDFTSLALLLSDARVHVVGVYVTPGDTVMRYAVPATRALVGSRAVVTGAPPGTPTEATSTAAHDDHSSPNAFPLDFRLDGKRLWEQTALSRAPRSAYGPVDTEPDYVLRTLMAQDAPVVYVCTGPLTSLAHALRRAPQLAAKLERVVWMGGAVDVAGNVEKLSPTAEWNVYADPHAARAVWALLPPSLPVWMMPLDATDAAPLSFAFLKHLRTVCPDSFISRAYHATAQQTQYYLWDAATVAWLLDPLLVTHSEWANIRVDGSTGRTERCDANAADGRLVFVALRLDKHRLYDSLERVCMLEGGQ